MMEHSYIAVTVLFISRVREWQLPSRISLLEDSKRCLDLYKIHFLVHFVNDLRVNLHPPAAVNKTGVPSSQEAYDLRQKPNKQLH